MAYIHSSERRKAMPSLISPAFTAAITQDVAVRDAGKNQGNGTPYGDRGIARDTTRNNVGRGRWPSAVGTVVALAASLGI